jgi:O-antigen/teichoic acid export membrane protein
MAQPSEGATPPPQQPTLAERAVQGVRWMGVARVAADALAFAGSLVLVRFIPPAEFGRAAAALGFGMVAPSVAAQMFTSPVVQFPTLDHKQRETASLLSLTTGAAFVALAPVVAYVLIDPLIGHRVAYLFFLTTPAFAAAAAASVPRGLVQRSLEFRKVAIVEIAGLVGNTVIAMILAAAVGLDGEAIVLGFAAGHIVTLLLLLVWAPRTVPRWHGRKPAAEIMRFGGPLGVSSALGIAWENIDYLVLSARASAATVGFYWRGFVLGVSYPSRITSIMLSLSLSLYSRAETTAERQRLRLRVMATHAAVMFPLLTTLIVMAPVAVPWLFGSEWKPSIVPTQLLAGSGMVLAVTSGTVSYVVSLGKTKNLPLISLAAPLGLGATVYLSTPLGLNGVAACVLGYHLVYLLFSQFVILHRMGGVPVGDLFRDTVPPLVAALPLALGELVIRRLVETQDLAAPFILLLAIPPGVAVYCATLRAVFPETWRGLVGVAGRILGRSA